MGGKVADENISLLKEVPVEVSPCDKVRFGGVYKESALKRKRLGVGGFVEAEPVLKFLQPGKIGYPFGQGLMNGL
jgi:hypothetical protein